MIEPKKFKIVDVAEFEKSLKNLEGAMDVAKEVLMGIHYTEDGGLIIPNCVNLPSSVVVYGVTETHIENIGNYLEGLEKNGN